MKLTALVLFVAAIPAAASEISGVWRVSGTLGGNPVSAICNLKQQADVLTGSCKLDDNQLIDVTGTVNGDQATVVTVLDGLTLPTAIEPGNGRSGSARDSRAS